MQQHLIAPTKLSQNGLERPTFCATSPYRALKCSRAKLAHAVATDIRDPFKNPEYKLLDRTKATKGPDKNPDVNTKFRHEFQGQYQVRRRPSVAPNEYRTLPYNTWVPASIRHHWRIKKLPRLHLGYITLPGIAKYPRKLAASYPKRSLGKADCHTWKKK